MAVLICLVVAYALPAAVVVALVPRLLGPALRGMVAFAALGFIGYFVTLALGH